MLWLRMRCPARSPAPLLACSWSTSYTHHLPTDAPRHPVQGPSSGGGCQAIVSSCCMMAPGWLRLPCIIGLSPSRNLFAARLGVTGIEPSCAAVCPYGVRLR
ncbi:hypothetical protein B0J13DRAFT_22419 [Dactylonectria estremocensis]|uniref:Uncharacterized protein n=1 Tax=Dactylonectria estremocensis TaxID=1079267 RepID=A0A9P9JDV7_9HYPO|nr:hypothetical protein B0J13DRAFT_22419 [Dactylonectria estremocensis]